MAKLVDNPKLAFRLARAIVSDIALYNQEKVKDGIKNDSGQVWLLSNKGTCRNQGGLSDKPT